jgi:hypothetical protein
LDLALSFATKSLFHLKTFLEKTKAQDRRNLELLSKRHDLLAIVCFSKSMKDSAVLHSMKSIKCLPIETWADFDSSKISHSRKVVERYVKIATQSVEHYTSITFLVDIDRGDSVYLKMLEFELQCLQVSREKTNTLEAQLEVVSRLVSLNPENSRYGQSVKTK